MRRRTARRSRLVNTVPFFECCFPHVCPEPVLVKCSVYTYTWHLKQDRFPSGKRPRTRAAELARQGHDGRGPQKEVEECRWAACGNQDLQIRQQRRGLWGAVEARAVQERDADAGRVAPPAYPHVGKTALFARHCMLQMIILPRQAPDKHRKSRHKGCFLQALRPHPFDAERPGQGRQNPAAKGPGASDGAVQGLCERRAGPRHCRRDPGLEPQRQARPGQRLRASPRLGGSSAGEREKPHPFLRCHFILLVNLRTFAKTGSGQTSGNRKVFVSRRVMRPCRLSSSASRAATSSLPARPGARLPSQPARTGAAR